MSTEIASARNIRWLVAETLVVVLGIVIALALDDYRTDRFERKLEIEYVERLQKDIERDLDYIESVWHPRLLLKRKALESIAPVVRGQTPVPDDVIKFLKEVPRGGMMGASVATWYTDTTFQDMRATGNLSLIEDTAVRAEIAKYYEVLESQTRRVERRFSGYVSFVHSVLPAELRDDIDAESMHQFGVDYALNRLLTDEYRNLLNQEYNLLLFMEGQRFEAFARSLHEDLEAYRKNLEKE